MFRLGETLNKVIKGISFIFYGFRADQSIVLQIPALKQFGEGFAYKYQYVGKDNTSSSYHLNYHPLIPTTMFQQPAGVSGHLPPPPRCLLAEYRHRTQKHQL